MEVPAMPQIRHTHIRRFAVPAARLVALIEAMWSGGPLDTFPVDHIRPVRTDPPGAAGWVAGASRFGHGPFRFLVERWDGEVFRARILTPGFDGWHGFELRADGDGTIVVHDLDAQVVWPKWLVWRAAI